MLQNGCICCTVKDNGVAAIEALMKRRRAATRRMGGVSNKATQSSDIVNGKVKRRSQKAVFDYILLETTGLADPFPIAEMFWQDEVLASGKLRFTCLKS